MAAQGPMNPGPLLRALNEQKVRYVIVGGAAMVMRGSSYLTADLDIVYDRDIENIRNLVAAIRPLSPTLRGADNGVKFRFDERTVRHGMTFTLNTSFGSIDLLGEISGLGAYASVSKHATNMRVGGDAFEVLSIVGLIRSKKAAGRPKDLMAIPELEALQELHARSELPKGGR